MQHTTVGAHEAKSARPDSREAIERLKVPLATKDARLAEAAGHLGLTVLG